MNEIYQFKTEINKLKEQVNYWDKLVSEFLISFLQEQNHFIKTQLHY